MYLKKYHPITSKRALPVSRLLGTDLNIDRDHRARTKSLRLKLSAVETKCHWQDLKAFTFDHNPYLRPHHTSKTQIHTCIGIENHLKTFHSFC